MLDWLPENVASYGGRMDSVIASIYYIVGAWLVVAEILFFFFLFRYRRKAGTRAAYAPGNTLRSLAWVLVPAVMVLGFDLALDHQNAGVWREVKEEIPEGEQVIRVKGRQFVWEFTHPGPDGKFATPDDRLSVNHLYVPVDQVIRLEMSAEDVIHSLWIPNLRFKQDTVPGRTIPGWFKAVKTGDYKLSCAELCGVGHGNMGGWVHVVTAADFQKWVQGQELQTSLLRGKGLEQP